jgi:uncharacterized protein (TIGR03435 family)
MPKTISGRRMPVLLGVAVALLAHTAGRAQAPAFEVATIKPVSIAALTPQALASGQVRIGLDVTGSRVTIGYLSLADLIRTAYGLKPYQLEGPSWINMERFDIAAKLPDGATKDDVNPMLQTLLAERFGLTAHREKKERPVYALVVGKDGPKLKPAAADADATAASDAPPLISANGQTMTAPKQTANGMSMTISGGATGPVRVTMTPSGIEHIEALKMTMPALVDLLTPMVDRPILEMTSLDGAYQLSLDVPLAELVAMSQRAAAQAGIALPAMPVPAPSTGGAPTAADPAGSSIFQSVQQLGLRLEPRTAPVDVLIVDGVNRSPKED